MTSTIWAVDDEEDVLLSLGGLLEDAGFVFRGFQSSVEFVDAIESGELGESGEAPDIAVVDLNMPTLSGTDVIKRIRANPDTAELPVVVLTALGSEGSLLNAFEAGADDVVRKPYSLSEFLARITWQLSRAQRLKRLQRKNADLVLLTELAQTMSRETGLSPVLEALVEGMERSVRGAEVTIYLADSRNELVAFSVDPDATRPELDLRDSERARDALAGRESISMQDAEAERFARSIGHRAPDQVRSALLEPLVVREVFVGVLAATSRGSKLTRPRESYLVSIITDFVALAVHRSQLFQSVLQESQRIDEANRELARTKEFLGNVIDSSPDAIVVSDRSGRIIVFNAAAERILGYARSEAIGRDVRDLYPEQGAEEVKRMLNAPRWGGRGRLESRRIDVVDADGDLVPVLISASKLDDTEENDVAIVGVFTDLRGQLEMEERLQEATESLERSRRKALIAELAGAAAHELNQPLTSLLGYAELIDSRLSDDDENRRALETILKEAHRIADVVRKIGRITQYRTKEYVGGARIFDLDSASEVEEVTEVVDDGSAFQDRGPTTATRTDAVLPDDDQEPS